MGLFRYYLRVFFRSHFTPVNPRVARKWEFNTAMIYFITAWTVLGASLYSFIKASRAGSVRDARVFDPYEYMKKYGTKDTFTLVDVSGFKIQSHKLSVEDIEKASSSKTFQNE